MHKEMTDSVRKEYYCGVRKVFQSKLNGGNSIKSVNTWAVSLLGYSAAFIGWNRDALKEMDRQTCKIMNMNGALHPRVSVARLICRGRKKIEALWQSKIYGYGST